MLRNYSLMKTKILLGIFSILISLSVTAQVGGPITVEKKGMKRSFVRDGETLDAKQLGTVLLSDQASAKHFKTAQATGYAAYGAMGLGVAFAGMGLYNSIKAAQATNDGDISASADYSNKSTGALLLTAGCFVASLPFLVVSNKQLGKSISMFNSSRKTGGIDRPELYVSLAPNGATIRLRF